MLKKFKLHSKARFTFQTIAPTKIRILSCAHISFKISMSLIQTTRTHPENEQHPHPPGGPTPQFGNLWYI
jgi:hypothetical protein